MMWSYLLLMCLCYIGFGCGAESFTSGPSAGAPANNLTLPNTSPTTTAPLRANVEEADLYRTKGSLLFYLHRYKGLVIFDFKEPNQAKILSSLPVYGYPVEMFVGEKYVFALIRQPLGLSQRKDKVSFETLKGESQLVSIDISDPSAPRLLARLPLEGRLNRGEARKQGNNIYLLKRTKQLGKGDTINSRMSSSPVQQRSTSDDVLSILSVDISRPERLSIKEEKRLKDLKPAELLMPYEVLSPNLGRINTKPGTLAIRGFADAAVKIGDVLTMTKERLILTERWTANTTFVTTVETRMIFSRGGRGCLGERIQPNESTRLDSVNFDVNLNYSIVNVFDVDPTTGALRLSKRMMLQGDLGDQFKQSVKIGSKGPVYLGVLRRNALVASESKVTNEVKNLLVSVDIASQSTALLASLPFGKPDETVRGSLFDHNRQVLYAITATGADRQATPTDRVNIDIQRQQEILIMNDPLYAIDISDPSKPKIRSEIDGLSGDINVFQMIGEGQFLLAVGRDTSPSCTGFDEGQGFSRTAVSIIDVRDIDKIRLVQRRCVSVNPNIKVTSSEINWDRDQAHKLVGVFQSPGRNLISVPVQYDQLVDGAFQTRAVVGLMQWDLSRYDDKLAPSEQKVLENLGTVKHDERILRTLFLPTPGSAKVSLINLSEDLVAATDVTEPSQPKALKQFPLATFVERLFRFGDVFVEVGLDNEEKASASMYTTQAIARTLRLKKRVNGSIKGASVFKELPLGPVFSMIRWKDKLLVLKERRDNPTPLLQIYDFRQPEEPILLVETPSPWTRLLFEGPSIQGTNRSQKPTWLATENGLMSLQASYDQNGKIQQLLFLDLSNITTPSSRVLGSYPDSSDVAMLDQPRRGMVQVLFTKQEQGSSIYRPMMQRWNWSKGEWKSEETLLLPGHLVRSMFVDGAWTHMVSLGAQRQQLALIKKGEEGWNITDTLFVNKTITARSLIFVESSEGFDFLLTRENGLGRYAIRNGTFAPVSLVPGEVSGLGLLYANKEVILSTLTGFGWVLIQNNKGFDGSHFITNFIWKQGDTGVLSSQTQGLHQLLLDGQKAWIPAGYFGTRELNLGEPEIIKTP